MKGIKVKLFFCTLLISSFCCSGQDLTNLISHSLCDCFTSEFKEEDRNFNPQLMGNCLKDLGAIAAEAIEAEFEKHIQIIKDSTNLSMSYDGGYEYSQELVRKSFIDSQPYLMANCFPYFKYFSIFYEKTSLKPNKKYDKQKIDSLSSIIKKDSLDSYNIGLRGLSYFTMDKLELAKKDFLKSIRITPSNATAKALLASVFEAEEDYENAIKNYKQVLNSTGRTEYIIKIAYLERKKNLVNSND